MFKGRKLSFKLVLLVVVVMLAAYLSVKAINIFVSKYELSTKKETFSGNSTELKRTVILPTLDTPIIPQKNNIWCSSFQLAWNEMKDSVIKNDINVTGAEKLCQRLNNAKQKKTDLAEDSYYAAAGKAAGGIANKITADMAKRFPSVQVPQFNSTDDLIAYAYLETYIKFKIPYKQNEEAFSFIDSSGNKTPVKSFGVWGDFQMGFEPPYKEIEVLYYESDPNQKNTKFALDLCKDTKPYQIVISNIEPNESLEHTYSDLQDRIAKFKSNPENQALTEFSEADILYVPELFWKITHRISEIERKPLSNAGFNGLPISSAIQMITFRLDRSGVVLKSESMLLGAAIPRQFVLDKPFLIYLKKRDAQQPFFVMWVDNAELLTSF